MIRKRFSALLVFCAFFLLAAGAADAKPQIDVFRNNTRDLGKIRTVLVMPAEVSADAPENEHFFGETVAQAWSDATGGQEIGLRFILKTPEQILEFEKLFTSVSHDAASGDAATRALSLAPLYVDAVMTLTVTETVQGIVAHDAYTRWNPGVRLGGGYWRGGWHPRGGVLLQRETVPAYDEFFSAAALKIEIRDAKDGENTLLYGISARDIAKSGMLPNTPSLTRLTENMVRAAAAELAKIKP